MYQLSFSPFPQLKTPRLLLRQLTIEDKDRLLHLHSDERVRTFIDRPKAKSIEDALKFIKKINDGIVENKWIYWAITEVENTQLIGTICLWNFPDDVSKIKNPIEFKGEIGYELLPGSQGKGIMQEAVEHIIRFAFITLKLKSLEAYTNAKNTKSINLLKRNGFNKKDTIEVKYVHKNEIAQMYIFRLISNL